MKNMYEVGRKSAQIEKSVALQICLWIRPLIKYELSLVIQVKYNKIIQYLVFFPNKIAISRKYVLWKIQKYIVL